MEDLKAQAQRFGTDVRFGMATAANLSKPPFRITIDGEKVIETDALIIATGATAKYLGLETEEKFKGQGVSACATCDGFFYKGQDVAVVGGGDTAAEEATYLAGICRKVFLIVRKPHLRASKAMQDRVASTPNIEVLYGHVTKEILGDAKGVSGALLENGKGELVKIGITGFFVAIGHQPNSDIFKEYLETDETGYIMTIPGTAKTKVPGVFACGDVQDKHYRQAITAAGSGCMAALDAERYLGTRAF
jgi:thioredoxin reductase (NADPH)